MAQIPRLYVDHPLSQGQAVPLSEGQARYLFAVMRLAVGDRVTVFNGRDGAWSCTIAETCKKRGLLSAESRSAPQGAPMDLWLLFAPVKKARTAFIVEKAVEMGVARLCPVLTDYTNAERVRRDRMQANVIEAAEQCGATWVPEVDEARKLSQVLDRWDAGRMIAHADETLVGEPAPAGLAAFADRSEPSWAVLIGPEGGFSPAETKRLTTGLAGSVVPLSLGPRILRAETAVVAALTLFQATLGDWR